MPRVTDRMTVPGLPGHWYRTLELPEGYQHWNWLQEGPNPNGVILNDTPSLLAALHAAPEADCYLYTQHQIFHDQGVIKHTRSSPNWEGGLVTYSTCKHLLRTAKRKTWVGAWLAGLCPKECASNTLLFVGKVAMEWSSNYDLGCYLAQYHPLAVMSKLAVDNPRGDLYTPQESGLGGRACYDHASFVEPVGHTRSVEFYKRSPGSTSDRPDGKIPKWYRDHEYIGHGRRPPVFIFSPVWLFSTPTLWTTFRPRRAVLRLTPSALAVSLSSAPPS
jgi:hypothetical protein